MNPTQPILNCLTPTQADDVCCICMEHFSGNSRAENAHTAAFNSRAVSGRECGLPHLMHIDCASRLFKTQSVKQLCPVCRSDVGKSEEVTSYLNALIVEDKHLIECNDTITQINKAFVSAKETTTLAIPPDLVSVISQAEKITDKTRNLQTIIDEARLFLGNRYLERASKCKLRHEVDSAINYFDRCKTVNSDNLIARKKQAFHTKLNFILDEYRTQPKSSARYDLREMEKALAQIPDSSEFNRKMDELKLRSLQHQFKRDQQLSNTPPYDSIITELEALKETGLDGLDLFLAEVYLANVTEETKRRKNYYTPDYRSIIRQLDYALDLEHPGAKKIQQKLPRRLLDMAVRMLESWKLSNYSIDRVWEYVDYAKEHGNKEIRLKAIELINKKESLIAKNQSDGKESYQPDLFW